MKYLVILFVSLAAQLSWAQTEARMSAAPPVFTTQVQEGLWMEEFSSIILNSSALDSVNSYAQKGGELTSSDLKGRRLKAMATSQEASHRWVAAIAGTFELVEIDSKGGYVTSQVTDTLDVVLTDLSVWVRLKEGVTSRPSFWMPTATADSSKLIKGYLPMGYPVEQVEQGELVAKSSNEGSNDATSSEGFTPKTMDEMLTIKTLGRRDVLLAYDPSTGKYEPTYDGRRSRWPYRDMMWRTRNSGYDNIGFVPVAQTFYSTPVWGGGWNNWGWSSGWFGGGISVGIGWNSGWNGWNGCAPVGGGVIYDPYHWPFWGSTPATRLYPMLFSQAHAWQTAAVVNNYNYWGDGCMKSAEMPADAQPQYVAAPAVSQQQVGRDVEPIAQASGKAITTIPATGGVVGNRTSGSKPATTGVSTEPRREVFSGIPATGGARTTGSKEPGAQRRTAEGASTKPANRNSGNTRTVQGGGKPNTGSPSLNRGGAGRTVSTKPANRNSGNTRAVQGGSKPNTGSPSLNRGGSSRRVARPAAPVTRQGGGITRGGGSHGSSPMMRGGSANRGGGARPAASAPMRRIK